MTNPHVLTARENLEALADNSYPGRGIVMGRTAAGNLLQVYWVTGRSEGSRNRVLEREGDIVRTRAFDESKVEGDPALLIYNAMRRAGSIHVVSNGEQTDSVANRTINLLDALGTLEHEPDDPIYTPRITGVIRNLQGNYLTSIARRDEIGLEPINAIYSGRFVVASLGHCIHTYEENGEPPPPFFGDPYTVLIGEGADDTAEMYWDHLNPENRVAVVAKNIDLETGKIDYRIINELGDNPPPN